MITLNSKVCPGVPVQQNRMSGPCLFAAKVMLKLSLEGVFAAALAKRHKSVFRRGLV
jgi:hypothetical protein